MDAEALEALRRDSRIELTFDGDWRYQDHQVPNPRVQRLFHQGVTVRDDGEVVLRVGAMWCYVACAGVCTFVDGFRRDGRNTIWRLRGGREHRLKSPRLGVSPAGRLFLWAENDRPALVSRSVHNKLAGLLDADGEGRLFLRIEGVAFPVWPLDETPTPTSAAPDAAATRRGSQ